MALDRINADEVTADNLNEVQGECTEMGDERGDEYHNATKRELQERVLSDIDISDYETTGNLVDDIINNVTSVAVDVLPQRQESMRQGGQSSAGHANEKIATQILEHRGLKRGERNSGCDFATSTSNDADLIIYRNNGDEIFVEVKSTSVRERVGRATPDDDGYWALFGFFRNKRDVRNGILFGNDQTYAWSATTDVAYVPPETVSDVKDEDAKSNDSHSAYRLRNDDEKLYLRANNLFAQDMTSLNNTGELTDVSPSHEDQFL